MDEVLEYSQAKMSCSASEPRSDKNRETKARYCEEGADAAKFPAIIGRQEWSGPMYSHHLQQVVILPTSTSRAAVGCWVARIRPP